MEAEITRLQAQRLTIREEMATAQVRADEAAFKLIESQRAQEEELNHFVKSRVDSVRLEFMDNIRSLVLRDLKLVLDRLERYFM